jgi:hypothetical protein
MKLSRTQNLVSSVEVLTKFKKDERTNRSMENFNENGYGNNKALQTR